MFYSPGCYHFVDFMHFSCEDFYVIKREDGYHEEDMMNKKAQLAADSTLALLTMSFSSYSQINHSGRPCPSASFPSSIMAYEDHNEIDWRHLGDPVVVGHSLLHQNNIINTIKKQII